MARYSGLKHDSKKGSGLMSGRKIKQTNQGLIFYFPDPFDVLRFREIPSTFPSQPVSSPRDRQDGDRYHLVTTVLIDV